MAPVGLAPVALAPVEAKVTDCVPFVARLALPRVAFASLVSPLSFDTGNSPVVSTAAATCWARS